MNKWLKIILIVVVLGLIAAFLVYKFYLNKSKPDIENTTAAYSLTAENLFKEYTTAKATADPKYNGKVLEITGTLAKVETIDTLVVAVFVFNQGDFGDEGIRCTMLHKYDEETKTIPAGTAVKIKGFCSGYNETDVILEKSSLVKN
jgi:hypothetical protein